MLAQQCATLPLGQTAPDAPLQAIVQSLNQTILPYRAPHADRRGTLLLLALWEQVIFSPSTTGLLDPGLVVDFRRINHVEPPFGIRL